MVMSGVTAIRDDCVGGGLNKGFGGSDGSHCDCGGGRMGTEQMPRASGAVKRVWCAAGR